MKTALKSISLIFTCALLIYIGMFCIFASESPLIETEISASENKTDIVFCLNKPYNVTIADINVSFNGSLFSADEIGITGTDAEKYSFDETADFPGQFTYEYTKSEDSVHFSCFFLDSYSDENDLFSFLTIRLTYKNNEIPLNESISVNYTITSDGKNYSALREYSVLTGQELSSKQISSEHIMGDVDMDNKVTAADARMVLRHSVGLEIIPIDAVIYANTDFDEKISAADARTVLRTAVGLDQIVIHSFEISLEGENGCEHGGMYTALCTVCGKSYSTEIKNAGHILTVADCFMPVSCRVCNETFEAPLGHEFDENGRCIRCAITKADTEEIKNTLLPLFDSLAISDSAAYEAAESNNIKGYLSNMTTSTKLLKNAIEACGDNPAFITVKNSLESAYYLRFNAFLQCTDEDGKIEISRKNFNTIHAAVIRSNTYIDSAAITFRN